MKDCLVCRVDDSTLHTRQSSTQRDKVLRRYCHFSWWWARTRPKHVEKRNKHTKKNWAPSWLYLQDYKTEAMFVGDLMHVSLQCQNKHESLIYRDQQAGICSAGTISPVIPASCKGHSGILWHGDICQLQIINLIVWRHTVNHRKLLFLNEQVWRANRLENFVV
jgi:hypothetical protein